MLLAAFAFIPLGLIAGSVARDMKTAPLISNLIYFPMVFLSGAAMPLSLMPTWAQRVATLLPATYVVELLRFEILGLWPSVERLAVPAGILILTGVIAFAFNAWLFRWESGDPVNVRGLILALSALAIVYGTALATKVKLDSARATEDRQPESAGRVRASGARALVGMTILDGLRAGESNADE